MRLFDVFSSRRLLIAHAALLTLNILVAFNTPNAADVRDAHSVGVHAEAHDGFVRLLAPWQQEQNGGNTVRLLSEGCPTCPTCPGQDAPPSAPEEASQESPAEEGESDEGEAAPAADDAAPAEPVPEEGEALAEPEP